MTFKVQVDSDKYDRATILLLTTSSQIAMLSIMYGNSELAMEPSNEMISNSLMGFELTINEARKLLAA